MKAKVCAIEYALPKQILTNEDLARAFPDWNVDKISEKTGIHCRHIAAEGECASDLGVQAAEKLFKFGHCHPEELDYLLYCTQSPDYYLPTTACIIQNRLGLSRSVGALDFNLGCSGYVFGLGVAKGLIETGQAKNVILITADTYTKFIYPQDRSVRTLFGDAAAATLIRSVDTNEEMIGPFIYGTDGSGANNLIVPSGGIRIPRSCQTSVPKTDTNGNVRSDDNLFMNGSEIFTFTMHNIPQVVSDLIKKNGCSLEQIDVFAFHQANKFLLDHLQKKIRIPEHKFLRNYEKFGNTVSSSIPMALKEAEVAGKLINGMNVMLVGFGVGYSWGACQIHW